jgi:chemotaxis protein CheX
MEEQQLRVFIDGATRYFADGLGANAEVGVPYLIDEDQPVVHEYTGIIGVTGERRGSVYLTARKPMLVAILTHMNIAPTSEEHLCDLAGEIANTISGNAQKAFGSRFHISPPLVVQGKDARIQLVRKVKSYAIPVNWRGHGATLVVSLN